MLSGTSIYIKKILFKLFTAFESGISKKLKLAYSRTKYQKNKKLEYNKTNQENMDSGGKKLREM
jgi:hypothetical protein